MTGWRFGAAAALTFLPPLALAIVGAALCGPGGVGEFAGGVGGLVIGGVAVAIVSRNIGRRSSQAR